MGNVIAKFNYVEALPMKCHARESSRLKRDKGMERIERTSSGEKLLSRTYLFHVWVSDSGC